MINILALSGAIGWNGNVAAFEPDVWVHGSGATLFIDGKHISSISEERLSRIKYDGNFPSKSIDYVLSLGGLKKEDIDHLVYVDNPTIICSQLINNGTVIEFLKKEFVNAQVCFCEHHLAHASAAFFTSGYDEASVLTFDGSGSCFQTYNSYISDHGSFNLANREDGIINIARYFDNNFNFGNMYACFTYRILSAITKKSITPEERDSAQGKIMGIQA